MRLRLACLPMLLRLNAFTRLGLIALFAMAPGGQSAAEQRYDKTGQASWYGDELRGQKTANGERFDPDGLTAAHRTLPFQSYVEVTALDTGRTIVVRINDRGPYHGSRLIDLSHRAARQLGLVGHGARLVRVRRVAPSDSDKQALRAGQLVPREAWAKRDDVIKLRSRSGWSAPRSISTALPAGEGPYFVRVATFSSKNRAQSMAGRLGAFLFQADGLYQVRLGPFADAPKLNAALAPLAAKGYSDVQVVR